MLKRRTNLKANPERLISRGKPRRQGSGNMMVEGSGKLYALFLSFPLEALFSLEGAMNGSFYELRAYLFRPSTRTSTGLSFPFSPFPPRNPPATPRLPREREFPAFSRPLLFTLREGRLFAPADFHKHRGNNDSSTRRFSYRETNLWDFLLRIFYKRIFITTRITHKLKKIN